MKIKRKIIEAVVLAAFFLLLLFGMPRYVIERVIVDGPSMESTLLDEDNILVEKVSRYFGALHRFDVIVFYPSEEAKESRGRYYIKRIIGLPGETVQIIGETIYINGEPLEENYGSTEMAKAGIAAEPLTLGKDEYFVLGDNRSISKDSRSAEVGVVPLSRVGGKLMLRIFPLDRFGTVNE
ncbi:MAG: signal peptidase I [Lachnospiraceae bacterium]|nr:signal peptidase I [Lachnospiraceae bacterium]